MKDNIIMLGNLKINLVPDGELHRFTKENGNEVQYYFNTGNYGQNKILFLYIFDENEIENYVQKTIDEISEVAKKYLEKELCNKTGLLVRVIRYSKNTGTGFEIYEDYDGPDNIEGTIDWMQSANDFSCVDNMYSRIKNGHQSPIIN